MPLGQRAGRKAVAVQGSGPVALHEDVGVGEQLLEPGPPRRLGDIEQRAALARQRVERLRGYLGQARTVQSQHVGSPRRQGPSGNRSGDDAGEVQDAQAGGARARTGVPARSLACSAVEQW